MTEEGAAGSKSPPYNSGKIKIGTGPSMRLRRGSRVGADSPSPSSFTEVTEDREVTEGRGMQHCKVYPPEAGLTPRPKPIFEKGGDCHVVPTGKSDLLTMTEERGRSIERPYRGR